ncbi:MAG TPA: hypothetical protein PK431_01640 [Chitinophagales bacterium]|nr:hypothetical protein [Chitinophagales bacterium]
MITLPKNKKIIASFEDLLDNIASSTPLNLNETKAEKEKRIKRLLSNYEEFCNYYFPEYCYAPFAEFHKDIQTNIAEKPNNIFLEQWSRGFAKSTHLGLFLPLFLKFNKKLNGMLVGSNTQELAAEKLADIQANLQSNKRIIHDFGEQMSYGNWESGMFKTKDDVAFYGFGKSQSPRGVRFKWKRPNYGLIDDLNMARSLKNMDIAIEDYKWVLEELKPALWTREWWLVVAQNKFNDATVTALLEDDEEVKTIAHRVNIVNDKGESNWIENPDFSNEAIENLRDTEGAGFTRERMNTPFEEGKTFKQEWLKEWVNCKNINYDGILIHYLDPSYKATDKSDFKAWVLIGKTGLYYDIINAWVRRETSKEMWEYAYEQDTNHLTKKEMSIKHCMEANFIQEEMHKKEYERVEEDEGRPLRLLYDKRNKGDKFERIESLQPLFKRRLIRFNVNMAKSLDMKLLRSQLLAIEKGSRINDDGPDALEGAIWMADKNKPRRGSGMRSGKYKKKSNRSM